MSLRVLLAHRVRNALLLVGIALCCLPAPAFAATQSLVNIVRDVIEAQKGTIYSTPMLSKTIPLVSTPSASIMIPANVFTGMTLSIYSTPLLPYIYRLKDRGNLPGTFVPANPLGPSGLETVNAHATTTQCNLFPTTYPQGSCQPRSGVMKMQDTGNKFGGTLLLIDKGFVKGIAKSAGQTFSFYYNVTFTSRRHQPMELGNYGFGGFGKLTNYNQKTIMQVTEFISTTGPYTTGYVYVYQSGAGVNAKTTVSGYDNRYTTAGDVKGTVSLVRPTLSHTYVRNTPTTPVVDYLFPFGLVQRLHITFLPEPSQLLSLGCCALALGALVRSRGR